jgi:chemotaxis protein methyltransferase CheR
LEPSVPIEPLACDAGASVALKPREFQQISELAHARFGLDLKRGKEALVAARLAKRLRQCGFQNFSDYYQHVVSDATGEALIELIDSLTTNHTSFLREKSHFEFLARAASEELGAIRTLEIWSAACSSGEEPYSISMCLADRLAARPANGLAHSSGRTFRILATDISTRVLALAQRAVYPAERFGELPEAWRRAYLLRGEGECRGFYKIRPEITRAVEFERLNLIEPFRHQRQFHVIFCRNVMMYFDKRTQQDIIQRLSQSIVPGGYLLVGHSESLTGVEHDLQYVQPAVYRKQKRAERKVRP